jgi:cytochrome c biogenesis protein CcmG, thiol:disulfide interchange protein DsbE
MKISIRAFIPLIVVCLIGLLFWRGLSNDPNYLPSAFIGKPIPTISASELQAFKGKIVLFNVWATWCPACIEEHEMLMSIAKNNSAIRIYGLNYKDDAEKAQLFLKQRGNPYVKTGSDPEGRIGIEWGVYGAPETFVIDQQGIIRYRHTGTLTEAVWREKLLPLIQELEKKL